MLKKLIAALIALCMLLSMATFALAEPLDLTKDSDRNYILDDDDTDRITDDELGDMKTYEDNGTSIDVTARLAEQKASEVIIYNVELIWGDLAFAWGLNGVKRTWNPETHEYTIDEDGTTGWYIIDQTNPLEATYTPSEAKQWDAVTKEIGGQDDVVIFNHSNAPVNATFTITDIDTHNYATKFDVDTDVGAGSGETNNNDLTSYTFNLQQAGDATNAEDAEAAYAIVYSTDTDDKTSGKIKIAPTKDYYTKLDDQYTTTPASGAIQSDDGEATPIAKLTVTLSKPTTDETTNG